MEDSLIQTYEAEQQLGRISYLYHPAILIACLGFVFGLAAFNASKNVPKRMAIRKVLVQVLAKI